MSRQVIAGVYLDETLTHAEMIALAEAFGGVRLYIPKVMTSQHRIAKAIGIDGAKRLWKALGAGVVVVPIMREERAGYYRAKGESQAQIARKLGLSEKGVQRIFKRMKEASESSF